MAWLSNPIGFTRSPVTLITTLIYAAAIVILILIQTGLPDAPSSPTPIKGINLTEAWHDLQVLASEHHPYNSKANDQVHDWLLERIQSILDQNKAAADTAYIFDDNVSNLTFSSPGSTSAHNGVSVYFEGTNIIVYVRGTEDDKSEWWNENKGKPSQRNGVLVNAHYDSVSTGYGATDDGAGVVSILQLVKYHTTSGNEPKNGIVLLLNNGEEDFLNGARVFSQHPMALFVSTFLNLEGAGAGGRAALFRSTDEEVTRAYAKSPYPFGTVISADAFSRGLVRSQTDYVVFNGILGYRGLDVAFIGPRSRYHTNQDDSRHTGKQALWHMLSAAVATTKELTKTNDKLEGGSTHKAIWFDILGSALVLMQTHTFFALTITVLIVGPLLLFLTLLLLYRADKMYLFSGSRHIHTMHGDDPVSIYGWRGFFRFPLVFLAACAAPVALAYLLFKENANIVHSSEWAVWSMMVSSFVFIAWFFSRMADYARPSALTRAYGFGWMCLAWWAFLVAALVFEEQLHVAGTYFALFYYTSVLLATWFSYLELFSLPKKSKYCASKLGDDFSAVVASREESVSRPPTSSSRQEAADESRTDVADDEEVTETSSLLRNRGRSAYKNYGRNDDSNEDEPKSEPEEKPHAEEQEWSKPMWSWLWLLQFIVVAPINIILLGQLGLYLVEALHQTAQDGSSVFLVYISIAVLTIFIFSPLVPFIHRLTWHIPTFLFFVLVGTLIYNLIAFPFSAENRLKLFFQQELDLDNGTNSVSLTGVDWFVQNAISSLPSADGQNIDCVKAESFSDRQKCSWSGISPLVGGGKSPVPLKAKYMTMINYNVSIVANKSDSLTARFMLHGRNTRACKLQFDSPISNFHVNGQGPTDKRFASVPDTGSKEIRLWSRTWDDVWTVDATWDTEDKTDEKFTGRAVCMWSDVNQRGLVPAFDEALQYAPEWVAITKAGDGLVEGYKRFSI